MNKKQSKHGWARVWPALGAMAIVAAGLTGGEGAGKWAGTPVPAMQGAGDWVAKPWTI